MPHILLYGNRQIMSNSGMDIDCVNDLPAEVQDIYAVQVSIILIPLHQGSFYNTSS